MDTSFFVAKEAAAVRPHKRLQIQEILEGINFILHFSYFSDILGVCNHCSCYLQGPWEQHR